MHPDPETHQGCHEFSYALLVGAGLLDTVREGYAAAMPSVWSVAAARWTHWSRWTDAGVVVTAIKLASDRSGDLVVRCYESTGARRRPTVRIGVPVGGVRVTNLHERADPEIAALTTLQLVGDAATIAMSPFQVVTLRFTPAS